MHYIKVFDDSGMVLAVPNPSPADADLIENAVSNALAEADKLGINGKAVTPFLLEAVNNKTEGKSLEANIALIEHNALIGSQMAAHLQRLENNGQDSSPSCDTDLAGT